MDLAHPTLVWAMKGMAVHGQGTADDPCPLVVGCQDSGWEDPLTPRFACVSNDMACKDLQRHLFVNTSSLLKR